MKKIETQKQTEIESLHKKLKSIKDRLNDLEPKVPKDVISALKKEAKEIAKQKYKVTISPPVECEIYIDFISRCTNFGFKGSYNLEDRIARSHEFIDLERELDTKRKLFLNKIRGYAKQYSVTPESLEGKVCGNLGIYEPYRLSSGCT